jgi:hypothetical protein
MAAPCELHVGGYFLFTNEEGLNVVQKINAPKIITTPESMSGVSGVNTPAR